MNASAFRKKVRNCIDKYLALSPLNRLSIGVYYKGRRFAFGNGRELRYDIGSVSKTYCAHLILHLAEKGVLDLDKTADCYLPLKKGSYPTLYELLTHRAGYGHITPVEITVPSLALHSYQRRNPYEGLSSAHVIRCLNRRNRHKPNRPYGYSDFSYAVLAAIAENAAGAPFSLLLEDFIKRELGISSTDLCTEGNRSAPAALGRRTVEYWKWNRDNPYIAGGGLVSDVDGILDYVVLQIESNKPCITGAHALCTESLSEKRDEAMCIGWHTYKRSNQLWHVGGVGTFRTSVIINRKRKIGVAVLGNAKGKACANVHYLAKMIYSELKINKVDIEIKGL